jgi:hypothetical protein
MLRKELNVFFMRIFFLANWWQSMALAEQIWWSVVVIATILLFIITLLDLFGDEPEEDTAKHNTPINVSNILFFLTILGWGRFLLDRLVSNEYVAIGIAAGVAGLVTTLWHWFYPTLKRRAQAPMVELPDQLDSTGQVLQSVPPHRNGFGKVQVNVGSGRQSLDAITAGQALPAGAPVRVVDIIDDRVVLVEPLEKKEYPHR